MLLGGALPFLLELAVETAPVGEAGQAVEARQFIEMLVGDAQLFLASGELARHIVERDGKRLEFGEPRIAGRAHMQVAAAETRGGAHQRPDRAHHELLAAEPCDQQDEQPEQHELQIGEVEFAVDIALHHSLVETDGKPCLRPRHANIGEDARDAVEARAGHRAFVARKHVMGQTLRRERLADEVLLIGRGGNERAAAVEQQYGGARMLCGGRHQFADPLQIDHRKDDRIDRSVVSDGRKRGDEAR